MSNFSTRTPCWLINLDTTQLSQRFICSSCYRLIEIRSSTVSCKPSLLITSKIPISAMCFYSMTLLKKVIIAKYLPLETEILCLNILDLSQTEYQKPLGHRLPEVQKRLTGIYLCLRLLASFSLSQYNNCALSLKPISRIKMKQESLGCLRMIVFFSKKKPTRK